jgi:hypothetical protein
MGWHGFLHYTVRHKRIRALQKSTNQQYSILTTAHNTRDSFYLALERRTWLLNYDYPRTYEQHARHYVQSQYTDHGIPGYELAGVTHRATFSSPAFFAALFF